MTRNTFVLCLVIGPFVIGLLVMGMDHLLHTGLFNSRTYMLVSVCIYIPIVTYMRSRYLKISAKDFFRSLIPLYGYRRHQELFRKP
ncbi:MAG TPA: hypothetical protein PKI62_14105 [bacterium]|nr:hypothetical protein [bacterium]HPR89506.1 hypothetical protein [bacterium]